MSYWFKMQVCYVPPKPSTTLFLNRLMYLTHLHSEVEPRRPLKNVQLGSSLTGFLLFLRNFNSLKRSWALQAADKLTKDHCNFSWWQCHDESCGCVWFPLLAKVQSQALPFMCAHACSCTFPSDCISLKKNIKVFVCACLFFNYHLQE